MKSHIQTMRDARRRASGKPRRYGEDAQLHARRLMAVRMHAVIEQIDPDLDKQIRSLAESMFPPIALTQLYLGGAQVADLSPLAGLTALMVLDLGRTQVADLSPLNHLTSLRKLSVPKCADITTLQPRQQLSIMQDG